MILEQSLFFIDTADVSCARIVMRIPSVENRFPYNFRAVRLHKAVSSRSRSFASVRRHAIVLERGGAVASSGKKFHQLP